MEDGTMKTAISGFPSKTNPGEILDDLGVTAGMLFDRFRRVGDYAGQVSLWNALQEFATKQDILDSLIPDEFGGEM